MPSRVDVEDRLVEDDEILESDDEPLLGVDSAVAASRALDERANKDIVRRHFHHPVALLCFLSFVSMLNYYDRGAFAGSLSFIKEDLNLSNDEAGLLGSAFIAGYAIVSPFMAQLSRYVPSGRLLLGGMLVWCTVTGLCFFANGFGFMLTMRMLTGIGEAAFVCLSPALIDDAAPASQRSRWLAIFFSMLPIGYALGYMGAGLIGHYMSWHWVFLTESLIGLPFAFLCYYLPDIRHPSSEDGTVRVKPFYVIMLDLLKNPIYLLMTLGYCAQTFVLGALTLWLPDYVFIKYGLGVAKANFLIGAITACCGILGNLCSSFTMDLIVLRRGADPTRLGITMGVIFVAMAIPLPFLSVFMDDLVWFLLLMLGAEFMILCTVTPVNAVFLSCVSEDMRGHSMAIMTLFIHLLGDMWSPYIFGAISESVEQKYDDEVRGLEAALLFLSSWGLWTLLFWGGAWYVIRRRRNGPIKLAA